MRNPKPGKKPAKKQRRQKAPGVEGKMRSAADHGADAGLLLILGVFMRLGLRAFDRRAIS